MSAELPLWHCVDLLNTFLIQLWDHSPGLCQSLFLNVKCSQISEMGSISEMLWFLFIKN